MEKERVQRTIDIYNKGWDKNSVNTVNYWMDYLSYCCLIYHFYLFKLKKIEIDALFKKTKKDILEISIDLQKKEINLDQEIISFKVDNHLINRIIYKLDDIDITLKEKNKIYSFEKERIKNRPWIYEND